MMLPPLVNPPIDWSFIHSQFEGSPGSGHSGRGGKFGNPFALTPADQREISTAAKELKSKLDALIHGDRDDPAGPSFYELTADRHLGSQPQLADYLDAPWASAYGMSKETAYSEAMENTAYRRSVADMQKAGLNPAVIFGAGNGYTAGSPSYVSSARSSSGGSSYRRSGSGSRRSYPSGNGKLSSSENGKLFSSSAYSIISALGGIVGAAATQSAGGYWIGTSLAQGAMSALNAFSGGKR